MKVSRETFSKSLATRRRKASLKGWRTRKRMQAVRERAPIEPLLNDNELKAAQKLATDLNDLIEQTKAKIAKAMSP